MIRGIFLAIPIGSGAGDEISQDLRDRVENREFAGAGFDWFHLFQVGTELRERFAINRH
jgi:hypothetical protein